MYHFCVVIDSVNDRILSIMKGCSSDGSENDHPPHVAFTSTVLNNFQSPFDSLTAAGNKLVIGNMCILKIDFIPNSDIIIRSGTLNVFCSTPEIKFTFDEVNNDTGFNYGGLIWGITDHVNRMYCGFRTDGTVMVGNAPFGDVTLTHGLRYYLMFMGNIEV